MDLAEAARRTLAEHSARVSFRGQIDPPRLPEQRQRGVTDFRLRRTHVHRQEGEPWADEYIFAGTASFETWDDGWRVDEPGDVSAPARRWGDPVWIVERLARSTARGPVFTLRDEHPHVTGEAWLDDEGRLVRVRWIGTRRQRPRSLWPWFVKASYWHDLELSDFGVPVEIPVPAKPAHRTEPSKLATAVLGTAAVLITFYRPVGGQGISGLPISQWWPNGSSTRPRRQPCSSTHGWTSDAPAPTARLTTASGSSTSSSIRVVHPPTRLGREVPVLR